MAEGHSIESNSFEALNVYPCDQQQQFRLNKINEIKDHFIAEIK